LYGYETILCPKGRIKIAGIWEQVGEENIWTEESGNDRKM
jgi:hypothetical protein